MSVLIRGMKMPRNCRECKIKTWEERYNVYECPFGGILELSCLSNGRQDDCSLVELPEKHGRLGDLDVLRRELIAGHDLVGAKYVEMADTVIEAEGET